MLDSAGTTVRIVAPSVRCWMMKSAVICWPDAMSVTLICAGCVGASTLAG